MEHPEISQFTTLDFLTWREVGALELTPKFQRREVWKTPGKSFFIDSLLREMPVPPIFIRLGQSADKKRTVREIIDGQQRLRAVLDFTDDRYALSSSLENVNAGRRYSSLSESDKDLILRYSFLCEIFKNISDAEVLEVFARVNTYSVGLNAQELRNGRYFGFFKQSAYSLALSHLEFWRRHRIFTESAIARMLEVELTSELMVAQLAGQQDKKRAIDTFYAEKDESFPERQITERRFRQTIDVINESVSEILGESEFRRPPLFYTLFCVIYHRLFGLPEELALGGGKGKLAKDDMLNIGGVLLSLSDKILAAKQGEVLSSSDSVFVAACLRQTDNIRPRRIRFERVYKDAFK